MSTDPERPIQILTRAGMLLRLLVAAAEGDLGEDAVKEGLTTVRAAELISIGRTHASHALNQLNDAGLTEPRYDHDTGRIYWKVNQAGIEAFFGPIN